MKTKPSRSFASESPTKKKLFLPLFLGGLLVLSTFAIIFSGPAETPVQSYTYHDTSFRLTPQGWESTVQGQPLILRHGPKELESLYPQFPFSSSATLLGLQKIYLSYLPNTLVEEALRDLYLNSNILPPATLSCLEDREGCETLPVKSCKDATAGIGVIVFHLGEQDAMTVDGTCVTLTANTTTTLTQMTDTLVYTLYGVFP